MDFVDESLGKIVAKLKSKALYKDTLIIVASKHGQAPIEPLLSNEVDPDLIMNSTGVPTAWITTDDIVLIFLTDLPIYLQLSAIGWP
jgi:predicted AlkP superfamily pyrophosphatase or phosphodiesterase